MTQTIHLLRPCVGINSLEHLYDVCQQEARLMNGYNYITTRNIPRRQEALLNGGSLYWIIKRRVQCRKDIIAIQENVDENGRSYCNILLSPELIMTRPLPRKPFQGWRYFKPEEVPPDLGLYDPSQATGLPDHMAQELADLGLI